MTYQKVGGGSALCSASASYYKNNGAYYSYPEPGDQVFFYYSGDINHTGIVETVQGSGQNWTSFTAIEGNTSDQVARRTYGRGQAVVAGFGRPKWSLVTDETKNESSSSTPTTTPVVQPSNTAKKYFPYVYTVKINLLKEGNYGPQVSSVQGLLNSKGFTCKKTGKYDKETKEAVIKLQKATGIEEDGEFGGDTFIALWNY